MKKWNCLILCLFLISLQCAAQNKHPALVKDQLTPLSPHAVKIGGYLGEKLDQCIRNRIMVQDVDTLLDIFRIRQKDNFGFNGEFFGKWSAAAALSCRYQPKNG